MVLRFANSHDSNKVHWLIMISDCQFGKGQFHIMGRDDGGRVGRADWRMAMQCSNTVKGKSNLLNE
jgi:hypothetical protein